MEVGNRTIKNIVRADTYNINLEEYYNLGLICKGLLSTGA
jgi:hypothetical protein